MYGQWTLEDDAETLHAAAQTGERRLSPAEIEILSKRGFSVEGLSDEQIEQLFAEVFPEAYQLLQAGSDAEACRGALTGLTDGTDPDEEDRALSGQGTILQETPTDPFNARSAGKP